MSAPSSWIETPQRVRETCCGELRSSHCCGRFAWHAQGILLQDWNERVHPEIKTVIAKNYPHIFKRGGVQAPIAFHLQLLSHTSDQADAHPTIVIWTSDEKAAKRAKKILENHEMFLNLNTGFDLVIEKVSILFRAGEEMKHNEKGWRPLVSTLCGAPAVVAPLPLEEPPRWRHATITYVFEIDHRFFAVLPAHVFYPELQQLSDAQDDNESENIIPSASAVDGSLIGSDSSDSGYSTQEASLEFDGRSSFGLPVKHAVYLDSPRSKDSFYLSDQSPPTVQDANLRFIGHLNPTLEEITRPGFPHICHALDYVLIEVDDPLIIQSSVVVTRNQDSSAVRSEVGKVKIACGYSGVHISKISPTAAAIVLPMNSTPQNVWELEYTLIQGDSGSPVFNTDGSMLGMAVATVPAKNTTYVIPATDVFANISRILNASDESRAMAKQDVLQDYTMGEQEHSELASSPSRATHKQERPLPFLRSPEETFYTQVFVEEASSWMDLMDAGKHFSQQIPFWAMHDPMLRQAMLACGSLHVVLVNSAYPAEHALSYYNSATQLLLKSLQNPKRDPVLCATTATVLNAYEILTEKELQTMNHIAGARALIRECSWDATTTGIGAACFWLNVRLELLGCLKFKWALAWDPDDWGIDMTMHPRNYSRNSPGDEEAWCRKVLWILSKVENFRSSSPLLYPADTDNPAHQNHLNQRLHLWSELSNYCEQWDRCVPPSMHPLAYVPPMMTRSKSSFPEVWMVKSAAALARLFYHTAMTLLGSVHPLGGVSSNVAHEMREQTVYHSRLICGIIAHCNHRGIAGATVQCLAIAGDHLVGRREQDEVLQLLHRITVETGWRTAEITDTLRDRWGWTVDRAPAHRATTSRVPDRSIRRNN